jgi:hypothetical protein
MGRPFVVLRAVIIEELGCIWVVSVPRLVKPAFALLSPRVPGRINS